MYMRKLTVLLLFVTFSTELFSQAFYKRRMERQWVASFGTGVAKYYGDLANPNEVFKDAKWNIELGLERRINGRFSARGSMTIFQIKGGDEFADSQGRVIRNLSFTSTALEVGATGLVQLFEDGARYYQRKPINVFLFAGLAATWYVPKGMSTNTYHDGSPNPSAGKMVPLRKLQTEQVNYSPITLAIPFGAGVKFMAKPYLNISVSGGYRYTFTDYLDDISNVYPGIDVFDDPLAAAMSDKRFEIDGGVAEPGAIRGNPDNRDGYFIFTIRADYFLPPNISRPKSRGGRTTFKKSKYKKGKKRRR